MGRICPSTNGKQDLQVSILLFEQEKLLNTTVDIVSSLTPRISWKMLVGIRPGIGQKTKMEQRVRRDPMLGKM